MLCLEATFGVTVTATWRHGSRELSQVKELEAIMLSWNQKKDTLWWPGNDPHVLAGSLWLLKVMHRLVIGLPLQLINHQVNQTHAEDSSFLITSILLALFMQVAWFMYLVSLMFKHFTKLLQQPSSICPIAELQLNHPIDNPQLPASALMWEAKVTRLW